MIVITGATGKIGSRIAAHLLAQGKKVRAVGRSATALEKLQALGAETAVGEMLDIDFLTQTLTGADGVFLMLPPDKDTLDFGGLQDEIGKAQWEAVKNSGIKNIVFLSSQGAHDVAHTGTVKGLGRQELRLNQLPAEVKVLSLRPEAFMENHIDSLKLFNTIASPLRPEVSTGLIASADIADFAAERLSQLDFTGKTHQDLLGDREYTQTEATQIIGEAIGKPELAYVQLSYADYKNKLLSVGMSESRAAMITERYQAINDGYFNNGVRTATATTPTSLATFAKTVLKPMFS
ncbi:NmrA family NAD(P)-binding protein [Flavobacterium sp. XGLA_31]|uniref:NmrA family NAD(P)-binding protein n=1 Tax=Flavobacterium sp. XGLA_31 TaxID=3447666 RepID=UPI003F2FD91B